MDKHYNVFVSSTFRELREERQATLEADIPAFKKLLDYAKSKKTAVKIIWGGTIH